MVEYYNSMEEIVMPIFKELIEDIRTNKNLPQSWKETTITLIPKQDQK